MKISVHEDAHKIVYHWWYEFVRKLISDNEVSYFNKLAYADLIAIQKSAVIITNICILD